MHGGSKERSRRPKEAATHVSRSSQSKSPRRWDLREALKYGQTQNGPVVPLPPGDIWQCLGTVLAVRSGIYRVEAKGATKSSTIPKRVPHNKGLSPRVSCAEVVRPWNQWGELGKRPGSGAGGSQCPEVDVNEERPEHRDCLLCVPNNSSSCQMGAGL